MAYERINIQLDSEDIERLDKIKNKLGIERAAVIRGFLKIFLNVIERVKGKDIEQFFYDSIKNTAGARNDRKA